MIRPIKQNGAALTFSICIWIRPKKEYVLVQTIFFCFILKLSLTLKLSKLELLIFWKIHAKLALNYLKP